MAEKRFNQNFEGYYLDSKKDFIPSVSGVYCVYECKQNLNENSVTLLRLIYIGESEDIKNRIRGHEKHNEWMKYIHYGNQLCFSFTMISVDRLRLEAALIFEHKPPVNTEYVNTFPFDTTYVSTIGANALLKQQFFVFPRYENIYQRTFS